MISFEAMLSSVLLLGAFSLLIYSPQSNSASSHLVSFANFLELSDIAFLMSDEHVCDLAHVKLDPNFCYSCALLVPSNFSTTPTNIVYSSESCNLGSHVSTASKLSITVPVYTQNTPYFMQLSKYLRN